MPPRKAGNRYSLLIYRSSWGRLWKSTLLLGVTLGVIWWQAGSDKLPLIATANNNYILVGAVICLGMGFFALIASKMSYIQSYPTYFRIVTPFLKLNVSYRRVRSVRPGEVVQLFPPNAQSWSQRRFLSTFYGKTAVTVELKGFPLSQTLLRLFLPPAIFLPKGTGFVFIVEDWMKLSTELDTRIGNWMNRQQHGRRQPGLIESIRREERRR